MHVRLGDRAVGGQEPNEEYFDLLEHFMNTVESSVSRQGGNTVFHIFSETREPCPSSHNGVFEEFTRWPVDLHQVRPHVKLSPDDVETHRCIEA